MPHLPTLFKERRWELGFALALVLAFVYIALRHAGMYPVMFADEEIYSRFARLVPLSKVTIPSYLYFATFGVTNACGDGFLDCARNLNLLFLVGAAPFIYLSARTVANRPVAMMVALLCVLAPVKSYAAYFMPESMYFFGFAVLTWLALTRRALHWAAYALAAGAVLGLMTLVKVHALFLVPALCLFVLFESWSRGDGAWLRRGLAGAAIAALAVFGVKFGLGYAAAGPAGLHLLGSFYGDQASGSTSSGALLAMLPAALVSLRGNLMVLAVLFALPLAIMARAVFQRPNRAAAGDSDGVLKVYALLMVGAALAMTVLYTASTAGFGPGQGVRLHLRYYSFTFPLLLMIAASGMRATPRDAVPALRWVVAAALAGAVVYASLVLPAGFIILMGDGAGIASLGLGRPDSLARAVLALQVGVLAVWALRPRVASVLCVFVLLPLMVYNAEKVSTRFIEQARKPNAFDQAGRFAHHYLRAAERNNVAITGTNYGELLRAKFHLDAPDVDVADIAEGSALEQSQLPGRKRWLLVVGEHALPPSVKPVYKTAEFALVALRPSNQPLGSVTMSGPLEGGLLTGAEGLAGAEPWGRWSNAKRVRLHFAAPLPKHLNLFITCMAFGPNADKDFIVRVGAAEARFRNGGAQGEASLHLETDGAQSELTIDIPQPASPKSLGMSIDIRELGIGLVKVEIGTSDD